MPLSLASPKKSSMRCKVVVLLLITLATGNWSTYADHIVKASEYTANTGGIMTTLYKLLTLLIGLVLLNCSREEVLSRAERPTETPEPQTRIIDTVSCIPADTTPKLYPIEFTVEVKDWEDGN